MAKNIVTRTFVYNMETGFLDCVSCSNKGTLSASYNIETDKFEIKKCNMHPYDLSNEIGIYIDVVDVILSQHSYVEKKLPSDLPF